MRRLINALAIASSFFLLLLFAPNIVIAQSIDTDKAAAVFEYDSLEVYTSGKKAALIRVYFKRSYRVRIQSGEAVNDFRNIILPEWWDPKLYFHAPLEYNMGKHLSGVIIEKFNARITKANGEVITPKPKPQYNSVRFLSVKEERFGDASEFTYTLDDLQEGDILEVDYNYSALYGENFFSLITFRIFFHGKYPILKKDFSFVKHKELEAEVTTFNSDEPANIDEKETTYSWHLEDLPGCMEEAGIRPHLDLPYVIISLLPYEMIYTLPYTYIERFIPFYIFGPTVRESRHLQIVRAFIEGVNSKDYNYIRTFIKARTEGLAPDTTGYTQLYTIHNYIAENCTYVFDEEYYNYDDPRKERMGEFLNAGKIRDRSRYDVYVGLISGINLGYLTGYLADKRSGVISNEYFEPTLSNDYLLVAMLTSGAVQFIYPKKERFGYFLAELPFYFENTLVRLIYLDDYRYYKEPISEEFRKTKTPASNFSENVRHQTATVEVDLDNLTVRLNASISLSGQFSTLGRGSYMYGRCDPSVNPAYCEKFGESFAEDVQPEAYKVNSVNQDFPFKTSISTSLKADDAISSSGEEIILDLSGWFNHISDDMLNAKNRVLPYYPDFQYTDTYIYQINFNREIEFLDPPPIIGIENSYGGIMMNYSKQADGSLVIMSKVIVSAEKVSVSSIKDVSDIQDKMQEINKLKIRLSLAK